MPVNFNVGLLGHVDCGKTTLAHALSNVASTAAFDKNPQSRSRGITLDLGFSALIVQPPIQCPDLEPLQFTFVDCPGHASLIRTIIGGAQIIDLMVLVVDAQKGVQMQTSECLLIGELLQKNLLVVVNKIDMLPEDERTAKLDKLTSKLRTTLSTTSYGSNVPIFCVSALERTNIEDLRKGICLAYNPPERFVNSPLLIYVDHCFAIKGQGTVCTGTVLQGHVAVNDKVELPLLREQRKVKSIQCFRRSVQIARSGDRIGLCVTQFNANLMERGIIAAPGYLRPVYAVCVRVMPIRYFKLAIRSRTKLHITVGHDTVMGQMTLFCDPTCQIKFDWTRLFSYEDELMPSNWLPCHAVYALLQFEVPVLTVLGTTLIASKLDMDASTRNCRLAFWGRIAWQTNCVDYETEVLPKMRIYKLKKRESCVQRVVNGHEIIVEDLFGKDGNRDRFVGKRVQLSTGEKGCIERTFGLGSKVSIMFAEGLLSTTLEQLSSERAKEVRVLLQYRTFIFNKQAGIFQ